MTVLEAITQAQAMKPSQYDEETMVRWLTTLDGKLYDGLVKWHEGIEDDAHGPYHAEDDMDTVLMVPDPYSELYPLYIISMVDFYNAEMARYNNSVTMYNVALEAYANWLNRTYMPKQESYINIEYARRGW